MSGASSFMVSSKHSECQVTTVASERRKGYASVASAAYLRKCWDSDTPWDAGSEASVRLAQSLGYNDVNEYSIFEVM